MNYKKVFPAILLTLFCLVPYLFNGTKTPQNPMNLSQNNSDFTVLLYRSDTKKIDKIPLKEYLCGVVAAEMQANYEPEALKAQTVAACTYTLYRYEYMKEYPEAERQHSGAFVCDNYAHCKSYISKEDAKEKWGKEWFEKYYPNIERAVNQVYGQVITYDGKVINAVFHAISSGKTESAENVWGSEIPYLLSVDSSVDTTAKGYQTEIKYTKNEVETILKSNQVVPNGNMSDWFEKPTYDNAGSVQSIKVCGKTIAGTELRKMFGLRSTSFEIKLTDDNLIFTVRGYGHQVGMSQNGANELAKAGNDYVKILRHYYSGVKIENYTF